MVLHRHNTWFTEDWSDFTIIRRRLQGMIKLAARKFPCPVSLCVKMHRQAALLDTVSRKCVAVAISSEIPLQMKNVGF